jgi:hypothetical protein
MTISVKPNLLKLDNLTLPSVSSNCRRRRRPLQLRHHIDDNTVLAIEAPL